MRFIASTSSSRTRPRHSTIASAAAGRLAATAAIEITPDAVAGGGRVDAALRVVSQLPRKDRAAARGRRPRARRRGCERSAARRSRVAFARRTGLPLALLADSVPLNVDDVRLHFESVRPRASPKRPRRWSDLISVLKAGLNDPAKPLASFFFVGPTGVGKTELAKALAEFLFGSRDRVDPASIWGSTPRPTPFSA